MEELGRRARQQQAQAAQARQLAEEASKEAGKWGAPMKDGRGLKGERVHNQVNERADGGWVREQVDR